MTRGPAQSFVTRYAIAAAHVALAGLIIAFYVWTSVSGRPTDFTPEYKGLYGRLSEAFLAGQTFFLDSPPAELQNVGNPYDPASRPSGIEDSPAYLHDASYYKSNYYLYFGPVPSLVLGVPFKLITGLDYNEYLMPMVFCAGAYLLSLCIILRLSAGAIMPH